MGEKEELGFGVWGGFSFSFFFLFFYFLFLNFNIFSHLSAIVKASYLVCGSLAPLAAEG